MIKGLYWQVLKIKGIEKLEFLEEKKTLQFFN